MSEETGRKVESWDKEDNEGCPLWESLVRACSFRVSDRDKLRSL